MSWVDMYRLVLRHHSTSSRLVARPGPDSSCPRTNHSAGSRPGASSLYALLLLTPAFAHPTSSSSDACVICIDEEVSGHGLAANATTALSSFLCKEACADAVRIKRHECIFLANPPPLCSFRRCNAARRNASPAPVHVPKRHCRRPSQRLAQMLCVDRGRRKSRPSTSLS